MNQHIINLKKRRLLLVEIKYCKNIYKKYKLANAHGVN